MIKSLRFLRSVFIISVLALFLATPGFSQDLGQGYTCTANKIFKGGKEQKLSKAKTAVQKKIDAVSGNSAKAKAKKTALKTTKSNLTKCTKGTLTGGGGSAESLIGTYTGTLTRTSISGEDACIDVESTSWNIRIRKGDGPVVFIGGSPFFGNYSGGPAESGFKYVSDPSDSFQRQQNSVTATDLTLTSASITLVNEVVKAGRATCQAIYTGQFSRDSTPPEE